MSHKNSLFIFRRDLRVNDNLGLIECNNNSDGILLVFLFDIKRNSKENQYYNPYSLSYLLKALDNLKNKIDIKIIVTENELETIKSIVQKEEITSIYENKDFTEYSKHRSEKIKEFCNNNNVDYQNNFYDYVIFKPGKIENSGKYYKVFTPFYKKFLYELETNKIQIKKLKKEELKLGNWKDKYSELDIHKELKKIDEAKYVTFKTRKDISDYLIKVKDYKDYDKKRNFLKYSNSELSVSIKFGTISIRELSNHCISNMGVNSKFFRQLIWREFWYHFHSLVWNKEFGNEFQDTFKNYWKIDHNSEKFKMWSEARTGVAIVDAAINELKKTGKMHNRARMIVASYLVKNLDVHWRQGELFFARYLLDYDPIVNHWSWQWTAGTGTDTMMYSRIFNPFLQSEKFDKDTTYRKKWLKDIDIKDSEEIQKKVSDERRKAIEKYNLWKKSYADN
jgi:deoxyribodipyrimidine photo-lyase